MIVRFLFYLTEEHQYQEQAGEPVHKMLIENDATSQFYPTQSDRANSSLGDSALQFHSSLAIGAC